VATKTRNLDPSKLAGGSDVLGVRFADSENAVRLRLSQASTSGDIVTELPTDPTLFEVGDVVAVSDCSKGAIFQITNALAAAPDYTIQHSTGGGVTPGNATVDLSGIGTVYDVDSLVFPVNTNTFFVGPGSGVNNRGQTPLSLWQQVNNNVPVELVEGVEDMEVSYGVDTDGDGVPNRYQTFQAVADPSTIITVRVDLTVNSVDVVTTQGDGLLRRTFSKTVAIRNRVRG
jgi:type IV pilus assembly protein PilW